MTAAEIGWLLTAVHKRPQTSARQRLVLRTLLETGLREAVFAELKAEQTASREREIRVCGKGGKARDIPVRQSLVNEPRLDLGDQRTG